MASTAATKYIDDLLDVGSSYFKNSEVDTSGKTPAYWYPRKDRKPASVNERWVFPCDDVNCGSVRTRRARLAAFSSHLTRRAKHLHTDIIGEVTGPRERSPRAFSLAGIRERRSPHRTCSGCAGPAISTCKTRSMI